MIKEIHRFRRTILFAQFSIRLSFIFIYARVGWWNFISAIIFYGMRKYRRQLKACRQGKALLWLGNLINHTVENLCKFCGKRSIYGHFDNLRTSCILNWWKKLNLTLNKTDCNTLKKIQLQEHQNHKVQKYQDSKAFISKSFREFYNKIKFHCLKPSNLRITNPSSYNIPFSPISIETHSKWILTEESLSANFRF